MKKRIISCLLLIIMVSLLMCACTQVQKTEVDMEIITDEISVSTEVASNEVIQNDDTCFNGHMRILDIVDDQTLSCQLIKSITIPLKEYVIGDTVIAANGESYTICSYEETFTPQDEEMDMTYVREFYQDTAVDKEIAVYKDGEDHYKAYYVLEADEQNQVYYLEDTIETNPFLGSPALYKAEKIQVKVTPDTTVKILDIGEEYIDSNMLRTISIEDFMHINLPDTALYHQSESKYYITYDPEENCYSDGIGEIKDGVLLQFEEFYTP